MGGKRGKYESIHSALLDDLDFQALSSDARHVFVSLRLCKEYNRAGVFRHYPEVTMTRTGLDRERYEQAMAELIHNLWIACGKGLVWVRNGLKYDPMVTLENENQRKGVLNDLIALPKDPLIAQFCEYYGLPIPIGYPLGTPGEPLENPSQGVVWKYMGKGKGKDKGKDRGKDRDGDRGREREGERGGEGTGYIGNKTVTEVDEEFEAVFWTSWHPNRRQEKKKAKEYYRKARKKVSHETVMAGVAAYKTHADWSKRDGYYVKHAFRWLRDERWTDEPAYYLPISDEAYHTLQSGAELLRAEEDENKTAPDS